MVQTRPHLVPKEPTMMWIGFNNWLHIKSRLGWKDDGVPNHVAENHCLPYLYYINPFSYIIHQPYMIDTNNDNNHHTIHHDHKHDNYITTILLNTKILVLLITSKRYLSNFPNPHPPFTSFRCPGQIVALEITMGWGQSINCIVLAPLSCHHNTRSPTSHRPSPHPTPPTPTPTRHPPRWSQL